MPWAEAKEWNTCIPYFKSRSLFNNKTVKEFWKNDVRSSWLVESLKGWNAELILIMCYIILKIGIFIVF